MVSAVPPLLAVELVFRSKPAFDGLPDFVTLVSLFLDTSVHLTLAEACERDSMRLLGRIWQNWQTFVGDDSDAPWSIHKFTRTDPFYLQFQWTLALKEAIRLENLDMIQWLFAEFQGYTVTTDVVAQAVRQGAIPILQFFLDNGTSYSAPESVNISPAAGGGHRVCWAHSLVDAAKAGNSNTLCWVHDNVKTHTR